ncbi:MAG: RNA polymerase sigma-70 factor [Chitinophagaceae bacterium]|nr:RNA polymerase sigma-70 factor [Chitinophagaceae bacterium]
MPENDKIKRLLSEIAVHDDQSAYKELFLMMHGRLSSFATSILKSKYDAEEVVSDVFMRIWEKRVQLAQVESPLFYLFTAVKNQSINRLNSDKKNRQISPEHWMVQLNSVYFNPEKLMMTAEMLKYINNTINTLPPKCRMVFKLIKEDGLRYKEVAELLGISVKTVEAQMAIALRRIGKCMQLEVKEEEKTVPAKKS